MVLHRSVATDDTIAYSACQDHDAGIRQMRIVIQRKWLKKGLCALESVDDLDLRLIRCLQEDPRAAYAKIARAVNVSETTVRRRVEGLLASRAITLAMLPDLYTLGYRASAMVGVTADLVRVMAIAEEIRSFPEVTMVALILGRYDILFFVAERSLDDLTRFMTEQIAPIAGIRSTETLVAPRVLKVLGDWRVPTCGASRDDRGIGPDSAADGSDHSLAVVGSTASEP